MRLWHKFLISAVLVFGIGCGNSSVTTKPDATTMVGTWLPDEASSTCPPELILGTTKLLLNADGTFEAQGFAKEFFEGGQSNVSGTLQLKKDKRHWELELNWRRGGTEILDGAALIKKGKDVMIEFWLGDPDAYQRLLLRKQP